MEKGKENEMTNEEMLQENETECTLSSSVHPALQTKRDSHFLLRLSSLDEALDSNDMPNDNSSYYSDVSSPKSSTFSFPEHFDSLLDKISEFEL